MTEKGQPISPQGHFHTHANITQTLTSILDQHYKGVHSSKGKEAPPLPQFISEAIHMICSNLGGLVNGSPYSLNSWNQISYYANEVSSVIKELQQRQLEEIEKQEKEKACKEAITEEAED